MKSITLVFPNQLFKEIQFKSSNAVVYLIEEYLFFTQYDFHKQKIAFHRASMKYYESYLISKGIEVVYINAQDKLSDITFLIEYLGTLNITEVNIIDPVDNWLNRRINKAAAINNLFINSIRNPSFLNSESDLNTFFNKKNKKYFQTKFYIEQRKKRKILVDENLNPTGEKWSFDTENRKKYPKNSTPPKIKYPESDRFYKEAVEYVENNFKNNPGELNEKKLYPTNHDESELWFDEFLISRFKDFGHYEDAIVQNEGILNHSLLSPLINSGLLTPDLVISKSLAYSKQNNIPLNSIEGFIRQIIGWREFIRGIYQCNGSSQRTKNFWGFNRKIPASFYDGTTGILPLDNTIKKVIKTGYCHHIERLMVLGNFMLLCEFDPDEVYKWFMELFIDSYDWVMVPNVYGMSQFADGGLMSTKPYISGSNYILKMSDYQKGDWQVIWDSLFWRFMNINRVFFLKNPRFRYVS